MANQEFLVVIETYLLQLKVKIDTKSELVLTQAASPEIK